MRFQLVQWQQLQQLQRVCCHHNASPSQGPASKRPLFWCDRRSRTAEGTQAGNCCNRFGWEGRYKHIPSLQLLALDQLSHLRFLNTVYYAKHHLQSKFLSTKNDVSAGESDWLVLHLSNVIKCNRAFCCMQTQHIHTFI